MAIKKTEAEIRADIQQIKESKLYTKSFKEGYEAALLWVLGEDQGIE